MRARPAVTHPELLDVAEVLDGGSILPRDTPRLGLIDDCRDWSAARAN
jgi:hypothetical protein